MKYKKFMILAIISLICFVFFSFFGHGGYYFIADDIDHMIFWQYHLPMLLASLLVGGALAMAGAILQTLLKNPLADASILGISSGSQFVGLLLVLLLSSMHVNSSGFIDFYLASILGAAAVLVLFLIVLLSFKQINNIAIIILLGVGISAIFSAATALMMSFLSSDLLQRMVLWQFGGFSSISWQQDGFMAAMLIVFLLFGHKNAKAFDLFALGETEAELMGLNVKALFITLCCFLAPLIAATVAIAGPIGFIGLVSPHIARWWLKSNKMQELIWASLIIGALMLMSAQFIAINILYPQIIAVGIITSIIGAPFLIYLVINALGRKQ
ncbi:MAG: FecCD family ABC transporter permease [Francisellaceae bacterium]